VLDLRRSRRRSRRARPPRARPRPSASLDGLDDGSEVERDEGARVDHVGVDAIFCQPLRRRQCVVDEAGQRDDRHVTSPSERHGLPDPHRLDPLGNPLLAEVQRLVLDEHDGVRIGESAREEAGRVDRAARHHDLEAGHVREPALEALRMLGRAALSGAALRAQHERHGQLAGRHEVRLRRAVHDLVERERDEVDEHDLEHRSHAGLGGTDRDAGDRGLADRCIDHPLRPELLREAGGRGVRPAIGDVLAEDETRSSARIASASVELIAPMASSQALA
jgi:hypothetical protein